MLKMTETELTRRHSVRKVTHINVVWCGVVVRGGVCVWGGWGRGRVGGWVSGDKERGEERSGEEGREGGVVWCGVVWCGVVWCCVVVCGGGGGGGSDVR